METWSDPQGGRGRTGCIITIGERATVAIHDRMPAIIDPRLSIAWLDCSRRPGDARRPAAKPASPDDHIEFFEVRPKVNAYKNDGPEPVKRPDLFERRVA